MKQLTAFVFFVLSIAACAQRSDGTGGPVCGNGTCQNGETAQSCPADCTTTSCNNNGTCDAGEDHGSCPNDCSADEQPPTGSDSWVCRGSFRGGKAYFSCNPTYIAGAPSTVDFVGECPALGLTGYYGANGHHISVSLNDMSVYEVEVPASATPGVVPYAGAKAALNAMTVSLAREYAPKVRVNAICAGAFLTDIAKAWSPEMRETQPVALGRPGRPEEVVTAALMLLSPSSTYTTGAVLTVDGGAL